MPIQSHFRFSFTLIALCIGSLLISSNTSANFATDDETNTIEVFQSASPAVVYVTNKTLVRDRYSLNLHAIPRGSGTGVIWNDKGYILTNYHVIEGARQITITLQDQTSWPAEVVGAAPSKDLAVVRIKAPINQLNTLPLGDSNALTVGHKVMAIGNPFGLDTTLTVGVVSALGREIESSNQRTIRNVIQTDAAINPGNSGGPLINSSGELIGINTAIYSPSGTSAGIGFAIPINTIKKIVPILIEHGRLLRPRLGIEVAPAHWALQAGVKGVPVLRVAQNSPAEEAGLIGVQETRRGGVSLGDIIIAINEHVIENYDDLLSTIETYKAGDRVTIEYVRDGGTEKAKLTLAPPLD